MAQGGMNMREASTFNSTDSSNARRFTAAADNPFYQTTAAPESFATLMRGTIIVRDADTPITFPYAVEEVEGKVVI